MSIGLTRFAVALLGFAASSFAARAAECSPPSWAPTAPPGYAIDSCSAKAWAPLDLGLPDGTRTVAGERSIVNYTLTDDSKNATAKQMDDFFVDLAGKAGAKPANDPGYEAIFSKRDASGEFWFVYDHGSGNEDSTGSYTLTTLHVEPLKQEVEAKAMTAPLEAAATCGDPPWLVRQFAYFRRASCQWKAWDILSLDLPDGARDVSGRRLTVMYELADPARDPAALAVGKNFVDALQAIGAKLASDPDRMADDAVLTIPSPSGTLWFEYRHGDGNADSTGTYSVTTLQETAFPQEVVARAMPADGLQSSGKTCGDPPWIVKQFAVFRPTRCDYRDFDQITISLPDGDKTIGGRILVTHYELADQNRAPTGLYAQKNFVNALNAVAAPPLTAPDDWTRVVSNVKSGSADYWLVYQSGGGNDQEVGSYDLTTVQVGGAPPKACVLEVYGVNFDFDKATLRQDSAPVLDQLRALFVDNPDFAAEIGGHTDNVGNPSYNLKLSIARANAVKAWLVDQGIDAKRVSAKGYGDTRPLVPNNSDENRLKNRRVELRREKCKT